jgi:hypothetical protein
LADFEKAIELAPNYAPAYIGRGYVRVKAGQHRQGAADGQRAVQLKPETPMATFNLACVFAQAAVRARADQAEPDREALAERYRVRALGLLRDAMEQLPPTERAGFWRENAADPDLEAIRGSPAFKQLQQRYARPGKQRGEPAQSARIPQRE